MRELRSGETILRVRASNLAVFFYKQEFNTDILKAIAGICKDWISNPKLAEALKSNQIDETALDDGVLDLIPDGYEIMKITWAMNKAQNVAEKIQTPDFEAWISQYPDLAVVDIVQDLLEEAMKGFFRIAPTEKPTAK